MAERSQFWQTGTTGDGAAAITEAQTTEWAGDTFAPRADANAPSTSLAVLRGVLNELAVSGAASPVSVATGAAYVAGRFYKNDSAVSIAVPTPAGATRIDRLVLRAQHGTTRQVRITRIAGTEGSGAAPALTQTANTTWDIPLAQVSITTGGVITITDQRGFAQFATNHVKRDGDTMTGPLTMEGTLPFLRFRETDATADNRVWSWVAEGESFYGQASNDALSTSANWVAVDRTAAAIDRVSFPSGDLLSRGFAVPHLAGREGGSATDWSSPGTTNYTPGNARMQVGVINTSNGTVVLTFPVAFSQPPVVIPVVANNTNAYAVVSGVTATQATITTRLDSNALTGGLVAINWLAIGAV